jgi:hypothetical protein
MCCGRGFLKRFLPFLLTFAAGLFIASFFVSVAAPFSGFSRGERRNGYFRMLRMENQRLQDRVDELEQQQSVTPCTNNDTVEPWEDVPPPAPPAPHHPAPPRFVR